jgi:phenylacetate-CoA ligase
MDLPWVGLGLKARRVRQHLATMAWALQATRQEVRDYQVACLRRVLEHAYRQVPLYRRRWDACGVTPAAFQCLEDLARFPCVTKRDFQEHYPDGLRAADHPRQRCHCLSTTGSTGAPVHVFYDRDRALREIATLSRPSVEMALGTPLRDGLAILVTDRSAIETLPLQEFPPSRWRVVDALAPAAAHWRDINRWQPQYLVTYPSVLVNLAQYLRQAGATVFQPDYLVTAAETMTPTTRRLIQTAFTGELRDCYATTEAGCVALTCARQVGFHVFAHKVVVEITDEEGTPLPDGGAGQVVLTDLHNLASPVIRYRGVDDVSRLTAAPCDCPLGQFPTLTALEGRTVDTVVLADGRQVYPFTLTTALTEVPGIAQFQIRQEAVDTLRVLLVMAGTAADDGQEQKAADAAVQRQLSAVLGPGVAIRTEFVAGIARSATSHKHSPVVSLVSRGGEARPDRGGP